ncbi:hypothetical protein FKM82_001675 [Ascaphus truei]
MQFRTCDVNGTYVQLSVPVCFRHPTADRTQCLFPLYSFPYLLCSYSSVHTLLLLSPQTAPSSFLLLLLLSLRITKGSRATGSSLRLQHCVGREKETLTPYQTHRGIGISKEVKQVSMKNFL